MLKGSNQQDIELERTVQHENNCINRSGSQPDKHIFRTDFWPDLRRIKVMGKHGLHDALPI
nr:MAG TPA: hypothetical protein [Caudoviricetes sp.]